jgi:hypothetical protein
MQTSGASRREARRCIWNWSIVIANRWLAMTMRPFENEVGVCAKRSLRSLLETHPSCPDLIRASINLREKFFEEDGSPGHQAPTGPRFARTRWRFRPVTTIPIGMLRET